MWKCSKESWVQKCHLKKPNHHNSAELQPGENIKRDFQIKNMRKTCRWKYIELRQEKSKHGDSGVCINDC